MAKDNNPCQGVCKFAGGMCKTCKRFPKEMANWYTFTAEQQAAIIADLPGRTPPSPKEERH